MKYISASAKLEAEVVSQWKLMAPVDGGATKVELLVTANFKIFKDSFQCGDSTNFATVLSKSPFIIWVAVVIST